MNNKLLIIGLFATILLASCGKPTAKDILEKSYEKCQSIENGSYEMTQYFKFMSGMDTILKTFNCSFRKLPNDSIFSSAFHYQECFEGKYSGDKMYTGDELINYSINPAGFVSQNTCFVIAFCEALAFKLTWSAGNNIDLG